MAAMWDEYGGWFFRIVREQGVEPPIYHFQTDEYGSTLDITQCGRGDPAGGEWEDMMDVNELYELGQVCPDCAIGLGVLAARSEGLRARKRGGL